MTNPATTTISLAPAAPVKRQIAVTPRGVGRWAVQEIGARRSTKLYDQRGDAVAAASAQARRVSADLVVEDDDGAIERWDAPPAAHQR